MRHRSICAATLCTLTLAAAPAPAQDGYAAEAEALRPLATTDAARAWLDEAARLPEFEPRSVYYRRTSEGTQAYSQDEYERLAEDEREGLRALEPAPAKRYYATMYGSPLAYLRAIDLGAEHLASDAEPFFLEGARVFDLGFGQLGQLRMLAQAGAHAVGADPDPILRAMYSLPGDTGPVERGDGPDGSVTLVHDLWPGDEGARERVGDGFDLIVVRNLLKRGYLDPPQETPAYTHVDFGVPDADFLRALHDALRPGGVLVVYTLGGKYEPPGESYSPSADIANPWARGDWESAGFEVIAHDEREDEGARQVGAALGWDKQGMNLEHHLFGVVSIYRRPAE